MAHVASGAVHSTVWRIFIHVVQGPHEGRLKPQAVLAEEEADMLVGWNANAPGSFSGA